MKTRAAILREVEKPWSVEEIELDPPKQGEVLVKMVASGLCHSDEHVYTGDLAGVVPGAPVIGGHEGAGIVMEVGEGVTFVEEGDHVVFGFVPACGNCHMCSIGHSNQCETLAHYPTGLQISDSTARHHGKDGEDLGLMCLLGTFAEHTVVNQASVVKVDKDWPLDKGCLLGCGVLTGWGSAVYTADVSPGEYVAVVGCGGLGQNAVQGAAMAGARAVVAIDPVELKRETATSMGATHSYSSMEEAAEKGEEVHWGRGFDKVIMTMGLGSSEDVGKAYALLGQRGRLVITNLHPSTEMGISIPAIDLTLTEKQVVGSLFGSCNIRTDIPRMFEMYLQGKLKLDELITQTYTLDQVNEGYEAMRNGENIRGVIIYD
ncbi:putative zinc-type alcohol dehydrogenase AdhD [Marmoricola endophyticus]|uniref:Zinc-type alcohol dehydrogenase AdhD n=1 Tax=Marmoricola endophyticus TaxID=2040280 RepID=A0A917BKX2_9ACTN|nr:NDMA-dependent alcohol dehydrogenase [Marmoricola endophyticus]GGF49931.1 putative zinc-type alcohol dehydrogenase AdhD [Marmoricola endophyticus]